MPSRSPPPAAPGPTDTVPAMLTPGEYVLKRDAVRRLGVRKLDQLNQSVRGYQGGGTVTPAEAQALQTAGQYAGTPQVLTPENAPNVGLDPARGYVAKGTPTAVPQQPQTPTPEEPKPPSMVPGLGTVGGTPAAAPKEVTPPKPPADWPDKPGETKTTDKGGPPGDWPDKPVETKPPPVEAKSQPADWPDKPVEKPPTAPTITSDQGGLQGQPPAIQPSQQQQDQAQQPPQPVTPSAPPSVPPSGGQPVKVEGITPLTDADTKEPNIDVQSNGYTKGRGDQSLRYVILHSTDGASEQGDINQLTQSGKVGVQYYVTKDGRIKHFVNDADSAWQAGKDRSGGNANPYTIGIEQQHVDGKDAWPDLQVRSTAKVVAGILKRNPNLTIDDVMGHSDIAGERKQDPVDYPWEHFRNYVRAYLGITSDQISASGQPAGHLTAGPGDQGKQADVVKTLNQAGLNATHFGYSNDPYLDPESKAGHGKYVEHMVKGYDVALNAAAAAKVGNPKPGEEFTFAGQKWRYGDKVPERYSDARFDIYDPDNQFSGGSLFAGGGGGKKGTITSSGGRGGGGKSEETLVPMVGGAASAPAPAQAQVPLGTTSGEGGYGGGSQAAGGGQSGAGAGSINLGGIAEGALLANVLRGGGRQAGSSGTAPTSTALANIPAVNAPDEPAMKQANVLGVTTVGMPQALPGATKALPAPPAAPGLQGPAPLALGPPPAPGAAVPQGLPDALKGLQALGIKKGQAQAMLQGAKGNTAAELMRSALQARQQAKGGAVPKTRPVQAQVVPPPPAPGAPAGMPPTATQAAQAAMPPSPQARRAQIAAHAQGAIAEKRPMHISYISAPKEASRYPTRESRTIQYEAHSPEARLMGTTTGQLVGHSLIPVESKVTKEGEPYVLGLSTNVMANNHQHINEKLATMGRKSPYPGFDQHFFNGVEGYLSNLNAGHTGTGQGYQVGTEEHPIDPNLSHVPHKLTHQQADFINLVINNTKAFAKANQPLRELARANGTLITEAGETNRMRHDIEQHEPGWRQRVLEPSVRSFKSGLIHEVHPTEESLPETIRPGPEYQHLTKTLHRAIQSGRPDIPISVSLHHNFEHNKLINRIERDFSDGKLNEPDARAKLESMGEDPDQYRFIAGSGGLITPYEESPEAITPEEHSQLKDNLRKQWIGGKMPVEDYRRKVAEVPLPEIASRKTTTTSEGTEALAAAPKPPKLVKPPPAELPEEEGPTEESAPEPPQKPVSVPKLPPAKAVPAKPQVKPQDKPEPTEAAQLPAAKPQKAQPPAAPGPTVTKGAPATPEYREAEPEEFTAARNKTTRKGFLSPLSPKDIAKHKLFMSHDGTSGAAVSPEGDIQNVFNNGGPKGAGAHAVAHAIENGGHTLDAFAPYLPHFYRQFGFKETGRMKFNRDYAPKGWDYAKDGEPDVVFMGRGGGDPAETTQSALTRAKGDRNQWLEHEHSTNYSDDWDSQKQASRAYAQRAGVHPVAGAQREEGTLGPGDQPRPEAGQGVGRSLEPPAAPPAPGEVKAKKPKKSPEQIATEKEDLRQADIHRKKVTPEQQALRDEVQRKAQAALDEKPESDPLSAHHYINGHAQFPDWVQTKEHIGKHFDEVNPKLDYAKEEHRQRAADALTHDVLHGLAKNSAASDWYDDTVDKSLNHIGQVAPKILTHKDHEMAFKLATAITSQGQDVFPNFESGYLGYRHWHKTGKLPEDPAIFGGGTKAQAMVANFKKVNRLWKQLGHDGLREVLEKKMTMRKLRDDYGLDIGGESPDHEMEGAAMLGPKIGSFYNNLNKRFHSTTFDLWATRNLNRIGGRMLKFSPTSLLKDSAGKKGPKPGQLSRLDALLANGKIEGADIKQQKVMRAEAAALRKLKNPTREGVLGAAPTIAEWAGREHNRYAKGTGGRSYPKELKSDSTSLAKNMDLNLTDLADAPRGPKQRQQFRDIYQRTQDNLAKHGIDMAHAANQAVLWFIEQKLFQMGGSRNRPSFDYLDASHRLVRKIKSGELPSLHLEEPMRQAA